MDELLYQSMEELKRVDHLIFVSLKYTRTGEVIMSVVKRLVSSYKYLFDSLAQNQCNLGNLEEVPEIPLFCIKKVKELYETDKLIHEHTHTYLMLRKIQNMEYSVINEYRRYVAICVTYEDKPMEIGINEVEAYYKKLVEFFKYVRETYHDTDEN